jgi:hypothetical protein
MIASSALEMRLEVIAHQCLETRTCDNRAQCPRPITILDALTGSPKLPWSPDPSPAFYLHYEAQQPDNDILKYFEFV